MTELHDAHVQARIRDLTKQVLSAAVEANTRDRHIVVDYSGHCEHVGVRVFEGGWNDSKEPNFAASIYTDSPGAADGLLIMLKAIIGEQPQLSDATLDHLRKLGDGDASEGLKAAALGRTE